MTSPLVEAVARAIWHAPVAAPRDSWETLDADVQEDVCSVARAAIAVVCSALASDQAVEACESLYPTSTAHQARKHAREVLAAAVAAITKGEAT